MDLFSEVRSVTLSVASLERALQLYAGTLGFQVLGRGELSRELHPLWRVPAGMKGEVVQLGLPEEPTGMLRLVAFRPEEDAAQIEHHLDPRRRGEDSSHQTIWQAGDRLAGDGFYALNFRVRELSPLLEQLRALGVSTPQAPVFWEVSEQVAVWDSMSHDQDGIHLDLFQYARGGELRGPLRTEVSVLQTVAIATHDVQRCQSFYRGLGFETLFDLQLEGLEDLLQVPQGVTVHNVNMMQLGRIVPGRVECFRYHGNGLPAPRSLRHRSMPPRRGILALSLETPDLDAADAQLRKLGAQRIARTVPDKATQLPGLPPARFATYLGPDGECLEIMQPATAERLAAGQPTAPKGEIP